MGDLSTHKQIFQQVVRPALRSVGLSEADTQCFELGNWLRDVSQFRDPYSFQLKKIEKFEGLRKRIERWGIRDEVRNLLNELLGPHHVYDKDAKDKDLGIVSGALGEWFRHMLIALGVYSFRVTSLPFANHVPQDQFLRIFAQHFTQYYPHEHLDFPPTGDPKVLGDWSLGSERAQDHKGPRRRILAYLDDFIDYIAGQLWLAELTLKSSLANQPSDQADSETRRKWHESLQDALVRLGKASHAIEDYYFHSNFTELAKLHATLGQRAENIELQRFFHVPDVATRTEKDKRTWFRRIRAPLLEKDNRRNSVLNTSSSEYARYVYTGMFGQEDVFYTFGDAFENIASSGAKEFFVGTLDSTLFKFLLIPEERAKLVKPKGNTVAMNEDAVEAASDQHDQEVKQGKHLTNLAATLGGIAPLLSASIRRANEIDYTLALAFDGIKLWEGHIGAVLLTLAANVEAAEQNSKSRAAEMDKHPQDKFYLSSDNGNSSENIGSHTLMAKDSLLKLPLRDEADAFARFAVKVVMTTFARQLARPTRTQQFVDWGEFLRRLMCHPTQAPGDWVKKSLDRRPLPPKTMDPNFISRGQLEKVLEEARLLTGRVQRSYYKLYFEAARLFDKVTRG